MTKVHCMYERSFQRISKNTVFLKSVLNFSVLIVDERIKIYTKVNM